MTVFTSVLPPLSVVVSIVVNNDGVLVVSCPSLFVVVITTVVLVKVTLKVKYELEATRPTTYLIDVHRCSIDF